MATVNDDGRIIGEDHPNARYTNEDVEHVQALRAEGYTYDQIAKIMDMTVRTVRAISTAPGGVSQSQDGKKVKRWERS